MASLRDLGFGVRPAGVWFLALLFSSCRTLGKTTDLQVQERMPTTLPCLQGVIKIAQRGELGKTPTGWYRTHGGPL